MRGLHDWLRQKPPSLFMLFNCSSISMASLIIWSMYLELVDTILVSMALAYVMYGHGQRIWMLQMNVMVLLFDPAFNKMASLPNVNFSSFTGYVVHDWSLESQAVLHRPKKAGNLLLWEAHRHDVPSIELG
jgi:hypothetical protein